MKGVQKKESIMGVKVGRKNPSLTTLGKSRDASQWSSGRIFLSTPHTHDRSL